ncbi:MAG: threonine synthase [Balneolales bacterium]
MQLYSTNHKSSPVDFRKAVLSGLAGDGGLFMPKELSVMDHGFWDALYSKSLPEIAFEVFSELLSSEFTPAETRKIVDDVFTFDAPLVTLENGLHVLELFHGPTLAFKDFGARTMAAIMASYAGEADKEISILAATSGDTGAAVARGFAGVPGVRVYVLYPKGKVSKLQEKQFTTLGGNITALEVDGNFDDCQRMVKSAFADKELNKKLNLTTANSINIARLLPQMIYYMYAVAQLDEKHKPVVFSVPSGNFGNLTAGLMARKLGLPVKRFIAATNQNNVVPKYLSGGDYEAAPSIESISNAMDVGNPSNFSRMVELFKGNKSLLQSCVFGAYFSDEETGNAIREVYQKYDYTFDPHGAVGYAGLKEYCKLEDDKVDGIVLATAHPAKFPETVEQIIGSEIPVPEQLAELAQKKKQAIPLGNNYEDLRAYLD